MNAISFFTPGIPKAQPRPRAFARKMGHKWEARVYDASTAEGWKGEIAIAAKAHRPEVPLACAVRLSLTLYLPRPKSHFKSQSTAASLAGAPLMLKDTAPVFNTSKPDADNYAKAIMDCLTGLAFWQDDAQVAELHVMKFYADRDGRTGCNISISPLT